jgi:hypothetical protein
MFGPLHPLSFSFQILGQAALRRPRQMLRPWSACRQHSGAVYATRVGGRPQRSLTFPLARRATPPSDEDQWPRLVQPMPSGQGGTVMPRARTLLVAGLAIAAYLGLSAEMALTAGGNVAACTASAAREPRHAADSGSSPSTGHQGRTERPIERPTTVDGTDEGRDHLALVVSLNKLAPSTGPPAATARPSFFSSAPSPSTRGPMGVTIPGSPPRSTTSPGSIKQQGAAARPSRSSSAPSPST